MKERYRLFGIAALALCCLACRAATEQDKVREVIAGIQQAAEEKQIGAVLDSLSRSYRDGAGRDYHAIKSLLAFYVYRHRKIAVFIPAIDVEVDGAAARARFQAILTGRQDAASGGTLMPEALGVYDFDVRFTKERGEWKAVDAAWKRVEEGL